MRLLTRERDGVVLLDLQGKLMGGPDADAFREKIHGLIEQGRKHVVVNLKDVNWVNSTGVGILITGYTTLRKNGGDLKLLHVSKKIQSVLYVTKLNLIFECFDDETTVVQSFRA